MSPNVLVEAPEAVDREDEAVDWVGELEAKARVSLGPSTREVRGSVRGR